MVARIQITLNLKCLKRHNKCFETSRGIQVASFLRLYFGPICKRRTALKHPEIVVKKKNSPEPVPTHGTWRTVLQCEISSLDVCLPLNMIFDAGLFFFLPKCHK